MSVVVCVSTLNLDQIFEEFNLLTCRLEDPLYGSLRGTQKKFDTKY